MKTKNTVQKSSRHFDVAYFKALRPHQWTKNLIVFAAPLFDFKISVETFLGSFLAFILFCAISSSFYLFNDIADVEADRAHPIKRYRPIASGKVKLPIAVGMAFFLLLGALTVGWLKTPILGMTLLGYALLQTAYNLVLKHKVIVDIMAIATGFVLRAYAGAAATEVVLFPWFILCTASLALFLGIEKRKAELRLLEVKGGKTRAVLQRYSQGLLARMENIVTTTTLLSYALWSSGPMVEGASTPWMMITFPFVLYGIFRYQLLSEPRPNKIALGSIAEIRNQTERPDEVLLKDKPMLLTVSCWILTVFTILWLNHQGAIN
jgi:4-hydroxybenzoate polyprenyltransferase